ncbi:MAG: tol-pal system protein YbgF [Myxococcales bacterium]|nr:tol-pal system protein YbgF [Myxococcales bacterium]MBK7197336.1 tol-pal system protein YbgF [Myxococcales bacterium]MBP6848426.1 tol-pal system protein YbgF [Kofleriaceae bacterium]
MRTPVVVALLVTAGCGGSLTQLRADNQRLAKDVSALRAELRAERRKARDLEHQLLVAADHRGPGDVVALAPPPSLPVEVLAPPDVDENGALVGDDAGDSVYLGDPDAPSIQLDPSELTRRDHDDDRPARPRARPEGLRDLPTSTALRDPPPPPRPAADDAALALYRKGQAALKVRDHAAAIEAFRALIGQHPTHDYADNAQYWIGEAYYDQKDYARAVSEFRATVAAYPLGNKVPDALVKIGLAYAALGETAKARAALAQVVRQFPKTAPAAIAATRLEQLP